MAPSVDLRGRPLRDLRISVTDRCNFRCTYCMPRDLFGPDHTFLPRAELLSFEEITRVAGAFVSRGVRKIRLTGGEPLLRADLPSLVGRLRALGPHVDLAMTTNGVLLARHARTLREAGLDRLTVSLDAVDEDGFARATDSRFRPADVLSGVAAATAAGFASVKVNAVVQATADPGGGVAGAMALAETFRHTPHVVRFIEYMDVGATNGWRADQVLTSSEVIRALDRRWGLEPVESNYRGEVARRYCYRDGAGEVGFVSSVSNPFCGDCTRARLSSDGQLFGCLFATSGADLRGLLRSGADDDELAARITSWWERRDDRYSETRSVAPGSGDRRRVEMSFVGG